jgi:hypothetical protein
VASWPRNLATCVSAHAPVHGEHGGGETDRAGPRRREREGDARVGVLSLTGGVRVSSGAGARPSWAELGRLGCFLFLFFFFSEFSNSFSISFL